MAAKRAANTDLNHDNWDKEEEPEERGHFRVANEMELKNRVIKKARRKVITSSESETDSTTTPKSVFSGFSGFGKNTTLPPLDPNSAASPFSFLTKLQTTVSSTTGSSGDATTKQHSFTANTPTIVDKKNDNGANSEESYQVRSSNYCAKLKKLNLDIVEWITMHVNKNPFCLLTETFKDYQKYIDRFEEEEKNEKSKGIAAATTTTTATPSSSAFTASTKDVDKPGTSASFSTFSFSAATTTTPSPANKSAIPSFSFGGAKSTTPSASNETEPATITPLGGNIFGNIGKSPTAATTAAATKTNGFTFGGVKPPTTATTSTTQSATDSPSISGGFTFGKPTGFSFTPLSSTTTPTTPANQFFKFSSFTPSNVGGAAVSSTKAAGDGTEEADADDDAPPKNEFTQVVENDAVYSKCCKVYVKKDNNYIDRGKGTLYLKLVPSSSSSSSSSGGKVEKTQLLVRADTNLGNILVNILLTEGIPAQRLGKNNVMLMCIPTPDDDKPTAVLLRVKNAEEADDLLETIKTYTK